MGDEERALPLSARHRHTPAQHKHTSARTMTSRAKRHLLPSDCSDLANISAIREQSASHNHVEQPKARTQRTRAKQHVKYS